MEFYKINTKVEWELMFYVVIKDKAKQNTSGWDNQKTAYGARLTSD